MLQSWNLLAIKPSLKSYKSTFASTLERMNWSPNKFGTDHSSIADLEKVVYSISLQEFWHNEPPTNLQKHSRTTSQLRVRGEKHHQLCPLLQPINRPHSQQLACSKQTLALHATQMEVQLVQIRQTPTWASKILWTNLKSKSWSWRAIKKKQKSKRLAWSRNAPKDPPLKRKSKLSQSIINCTRQLPHLLQNNQKWTPKKTMARKRLILQKNPSPL